jgi:hypothetical protein
LHGYFLLAVNAFVMLHKALRDRQAMTALLPRDAAEQDEPDASRKRYRCRGGRKPQGLPAACLACHAARK